MNILFSLILLLIPLLFIGYGMGAIFSASIRAEMKRRKEAFIFLAVISLLCLYLAIPSGSRADRAKMTTQYRLNHIRAAILNYETEYSSPPSTSDNAALMKVLRSNNPKKDVFITFTRRERDAKGEAIDAWGTPVRISLDDPANPVVQSAGPDKIWDTKDDLTSKAK